MLASGGPRPGRSRTVARVLAVAAVCAAGLAPAPARADTTPANCADDPFEFYTPNGPALARVCLTEPVAGPVSGVVTVTATLTNVGQTTQPASRFAARRMVFTLDGQPLLTAYEAAPRSVYDPSVYTFQLTTSHWVDGDHLLQAYAVMGDTLETPSSEDPVPAPGHVTVQAGVPLTFSNGISVVPPNPRSFTPATGTQPAAGKPFVLAATGDGAGGEPEADAVINRIASWDPDLFLYLGDVYEDGTLTEFENWYGTGGSHWSRFRDITNPTVGNHEYVNGVAPGYFSYWDNIPDYYSFDANGWHFVNLDSNSIIGQQPGSPQYEWLKSDLVANSAACTVAYFHHPPFNVGAQGYATRMSAMWDLMNDMGVDIVLTGHDHNYQRWTPLGAAGTPTGMGMTEFVAGAGGHGVRPFATTDARMKVGYDTTPQGLGALKFELGPDRATFSYINASGAVLDSGQILCERSPYEADSPRHEIYISRARLQRLLAAGGAAAGKLTSAIGHLDNAQADAMWSSDWRPVAVNGQVVVDEMKKTANDLAGIAGADPQVPATMTLLSDTGQKLAQAAIDEAVAAFGALSKVDQARTQLSDGQKRAASGDPVGALDKFKQAFQSARDGLATAPSSWTSGVGIRGRLGDRLAGLYALYPTGSGGDDGRLESAVNELGKALDLKLWRDQSVPADKNVFDQMKKTLAQLKGIANTDVSSYQVEICAAARSISVAAIDAAVARGGSSSKIATARSKLAEADAKVATGKYDESMDRFRDAWLNAISA